MLLKCNECGHENQLGSIFCRDCGVKLDVENMRPEVKDAKSSASIKDIIKNIFAITVILGLVGVVGLICYPETATFSELTQDEQQKTDIKFQNLINKIEGEPAEDSYVFTPDEATYLYNNKLTEKVEDASGGYAIEKMTISLNAYDNIVLTADAKLFGIIPTSFTIEGELLDETPELNILNAKMGHLSMPSFLQQKVITKFTPVLDAGAIKKILDATQKLSIENSDFHITVEDKSSR